jgi:4-aminobutyrate aminotransferase-like enzyme
MAEQIQGRGGVKHFSQRFFSEIRKKIEFKKSETDSAEKNL